MKTSKLLIFGMVTAVLCSAAARGGHAAAEAGLKISSTSPALATIFDSGSPEREKNEEYP